MGSTICRHGHFATMIRLRRFAIIAILPAGFLIGLGGAGYWWISREETPAYVTAPVSRGDIERDITMTGSVNPQVTVQVGSYVSGIVKSLGCDFNTEVKVGQVCARIDPQPFQVVVDQSRADVTTAEAQLGKDRAALAYAKASLERDRILLGRDIVSRDQVDSDQSTYDQANAQIAYDEATIVSKKAALKAALVNLGYTEIVSPVDGTVITRNVDVGQTVVSSLQSSTLFLIGKDMTRMQVDTNVSEADISAVQAGQQAAFSVQAYPDRTFRGTVTEIRRAPITVQSVVTYDVVVTVDNPDLALFPGMTADTRIVIARRHDILRVPLPALRFTPKDGQSRGTDHRRAEDDSNEGTGRVWVLKDGRPHPIRVKTGVEDGKLIEVESPELRADDRVVLSEIRPRERRGVPTQPFRRGNVRL